MIKLASNLSLPLSFVTQTQAILGRKGSGKTSTARKQAEQMLFARQQIVAIDPTGAWWGLRASADGRGTAFPILIIGGDHGDIPLEEQAGETIAQAIVDERFSAVLDLSLLRKAAQHRFMTAFLETLYRQNREAMHLFCDEADTVAPQKPFGDDMRTLHAMQDIVRRGRKKGIGCTLITQRPQVLNKDVLTQCEVLTVLRLTHPRDLDAVSEWVNYQGDSKLGDEMIRSLPPLPVGTAWFWSPGWPDSDGIFKRVAVDACVTFDSGATPEPGRAAKQPKALAKVDIQKLGKAISEKAEEVKANDPKSLKARITQLERELQNRPASTKVVEKHVFRAGEVEKLQSSIQKLQERISEEFNLLVGLISQADTAISKVTQRITAGHAVNSGIKAITRDKIAPSSRPASSIPVEKPEGGLGKGELAVLSAIAQQPIGATREQLTVLTGYKRSSRDTYLQRLMAAGHIFFSGNCFVANDSGRAALGPDFRPLPTGDALREHYLQTLPEGERKVLEVLVSHYPHPVVRADLDAHTGYKRSSRDTYLQRLAARQVVQIRGQEVSASPELFD